MAGWRLRRVPLVPYNERGEPRTPPDVWQVLPPEGSTLEALLASGGQALPPDTYARSLRSLVAAVGAPETGLLDDTWESDAGIAFSQPTGPERDFSEVSWSWRDPTQTLVPLMLQTVTAPGHDDAELAGFVTSIVELDGTVHASGRFYDNEAGRAFRDLLLDGRRFGVSVDPGENTSAEWICTEYDEDGFCVAGRMSFLTYEIAGLTGTPFPGFERASIRLTSARTLEPAGVVAAAATLGVSPAEVLEIQEDHARLLNGLPPYGATVPATLGGGPAGDSLDIGRRRLEDLDTSRFLNVGRLRTSTGRYAAPPAEWYRMPEPDLDSGLLVEQDDGSFGVPLTITDEGQVFGHVARWGQCHTGYPDECVQAPPSRTGYAGFHLGLTRLDDGTELPTGVLTAGCDHASIRLRAPQAREHYDHSGVGWSTVRAVDGALGIWTCGGLRPDVTDEQADLLRSLSLSGDWRRDRGTGFFEMLAVLAVNVPGFPQRRRPVLTASGGLWLDTIGVVDQPLALWLDDELESLVASGLVRRPGCGCGSHGSVAARLEVLEANVERLTRLTVRR